MNYGLLLVIWSAVTYRVTRFIILDDLIERQRNWVRFKIILRYNRRGELPAWRDKLDTLLGCPWCVTIWIAAGTLTAHRWLVGDFPLPVWAWLVAATGAVLLWKVLDSDEE